VTHHRGRARHRLLIVVVATLAVVAPACRDAAPVSEPRATEPPVTVAGHTETSADPRTDRRLVVGLLFAATGAQAGTDHPVAITTRAQLARQRAAGVALDVLEADTASVLATGTDAARRLLDAGAEVLLVGCDGDVLVNAARVASRRQALVISACAGDTRFGADVAGTLAFTLGAANDVQGALLAERAMANGWDRALTITDLTPADGTQQCRAFTTRYRALGGTTVAELEVAADSSGDEVAAQAARLPAPAVVISCVGAGRVGEFLGALRARGVTAPVLAGTGGDGVDGVGHLTPVVLAPDTRAVQSLQATGAPVYGRALLGAAAVDVVLALAVGDPTADGPQLAAALRRAPVATAFGTFRVDAGQRLVADPPTFVG
jgi:ABC-type branched-subunit amino acid transport system substrate-binding protein